MLCIPFANFPKGKEGFLLLKKTPSIPGIICNPYYKLSRRYGIFAVTIIMPRGSRFVRFVSFIPDKLSRQPAKEPPQGTSFV